MPSSRNSSKTSTIIFLAALTLTLAFAVVQRQETARLSQDLVAAQEALMKSQTAAREQVASVATLEKQVADLTEVLTKSTEKLQQATAALSAAQPARQAPPPLSAAELSQLQAAVKEPIITTETDRKGAEIKKYIFPELIDVNGKPLASDMEFTRLYGTKLAFRSPTGTPASYEAETLHPGILAHLGINLYDAKQKQEEWEEQIRKRKELALLQQAARKKAEIKRLEHQAKRQKEEFDRQTKIAKIESDRMLAEAAIRRAEAAMVEAQRPPDNHYYGQPYNNAYNYGYGLGTRFVPSRSNANGPQARTANQVPVPQGAPQPKPFVAPSGQLPPRGQLKIP